MPAFYELRLLAPDDVALMEGMLTTFGQAFDDVQTYTKLGTREDVLHFDIDVRR
jgi:hypothetical protein